MYGQREISVSQLKRQVIEPSEPLLGREEPINENLLFLVDFRKPSTLDYMLGSSGYAMGNQHTMNWFHKECTLVVGGKRRISTIICSLRYCV